ncbi:hypothetical protein JNL27_04955, partial [bacterium]|nr:hypothetical protein [bacterium]
MKDFFFKYWIIGVVFIGAGMVVFVVPPILHAVIENKIRDAIERTEKRVNCKITLQSLTFLNTSTFQIENLSIASDSFTISALSRAGIDDSSKLL